ESAAPRPLGSWSSPVMVLDAGLEPLLAKGLPCRSQTDSSKHDRGSRVEDSMADLVVIAFPTEAKAEEVRQKLFAMQKEYLIELGDAVIAVKDAHGRIKLNQLLNTTAAGAVSGTFWGSLIGLIFLMPLTGAAIGAASGAISGALTDVGIKDR